MKLGKELALFFVGGLLGFVVDAGVVQVLVSAFHWNPYLGRVVSFLLAATATWWWNRSRTFAARQSGRSLPAEWLHWLALMGGGAAVNYGVYALCLWRFPEWKPWPVIPVAIGSVAAAGVNYLSARLVLFRGAKTNP